MEEQHIYSQVLRNLITQCLEYYPAKRPTIENLVAEIRLNRDNFDDLDTAFEDMGDEKVSRKGASIFKLDSMADIEFLVERPESVGEEEEVVDD